MNNLETMSLLGRCLAPGRENLNGLLADRLASPGTDWKRLMLIASGHYLAPALGLALKRRGLSDLSPGEIREILEAAELLNRERNALLYRQLLAIVRGLNSAGIAPLLLKGAVSLLPGAVAGVALAYAMYSSTHAVTGVHIEFHLEYGLLGVSLAFAAATAWLAARIPARQAARVDAFEDGARSRIARGKRNQAADEKDRGGQQTDRTEDDTQIGKAREVEYCHRRECY